MVEERKQGAEPTRDPSVGRNVVAMRVPGAGRSVVTEIERDEGDARLDQSACEKRLLAPQVLSITIADFRRLAGQIEGLLGAASEQKIGGLLLIRVERVHRPAGVEPGAQPVEFV